MTALRENPNFNDSSRTIRIPGKTEIYAKAETFKKRYLWLLVVAMILTLYTILLSAYVNYKTEKRVKAECAAAYSAQLEAYKADQAYQEQAKAFLSGADSLNAAINQAVDAVAPVIAKLSNDNQKYTEVCCMLARVMSPAFPNSFQEVAEQPSQWMFYDGKNKTYSEHDREIAEAIIRPYMESGIIPKGLTYSMVYAEWTSTDYVLRDSYKTTSTMHTWRYGS